VLLSLETVESVETLETPAHSFVEFHWCVPARISNEFQNPQFKIMLLKRALETLETLAIS